MEKQAVMGALDRAIETVADREFDRLWKATPLSEIGKRVEGALMSLRRLSQGLMPTYDEWDTLFYCTWYQPAQVNLVYSIAQTMLYQRTPMARAEPAQSVSRLRVVDFGCGALATQLGLALAWADARERGARLASVHIDLIDQSPAMMNLGRAIWEEFRQNVSRDPHLRVLAGICDVLDATFHISPQTLEEPADGEICWLSAFHTVYPQNQAEVKSQLAYIVSRVDPDIGIITTHSAKRQLAADVSPFNPRLYEESGSYGFAPQLSGSVHRTTGWREGIMASIDTMRYDGVLDDNFDWGLVENYLSRGVSWMWRPAACLIYTYVVKNLAPSGDLDDLPF